MSIALRLVRVLHQLGKPGRLRIDKQVDDILIQCPLIGEDRPAPTRRFAL